MARNNGKNSSFLVVIFKVSQIILYKFTKKSLSFNNEISSTGIFQFFMIYKVIHER